MSEYQYCEFAAVDRLLDSRDLEVLRGLSTRAHITPTSILRLPAQLIDLDIAQPYSSGNPVAASNQGDHVVLQRLGRLRQEPGRKLTFVERLANAGL